MKNIFLFLLLAFGAWGCSEDRISVYEGGVNSVYFTVEYNEVWKDTLDFSFAICKANDTIIPFKVQALGDMTDYDRTFKVIVDERSTATAGRHFDVLQAEYVLPANSRDAVVPVRIHRTSDLYDTIVSVTLHLVPNEYFSQAVTERKYQGEYMDIIHKTLMFTSITTKPTMWLDYYLGYFSVAKFELTNKLLEIDPVIWYSAKTMTMGQMIGAGTFMTNYLNDRIDPENPERAIKDPDPKSTRGYMTFSNVKIPPEFPDAWPK